MHIKAKVGQMGCSALGTIGTYNPTLSTGPDFLIAANELHQNEARIARILEEMRSLWPPSG